MNLRNILIVLGFLMSVPVFSQENITLEGKIIASELQESTFHIINKTQGTGTVNSASGKFSIKVRENDTLLLSSVQYNNVEIRITGKILDLRVLTVELTEDINELAEVNLSNIKLTGNLNTDLKNIEVVKDLPFNLSFGDVKNARYESDINDPLAAPVNLAFQQNAVSEGAGGLNILVGLKMLADIAGINGKEKVVYGPPSAPASIQVRNLFKDDFFLTSLGLNKESIRDFIFYLDDMGLSSQLFQPENRLALIELLIDQSKIYKERFNKN